MVYFWDGLWLCSLAWTELCNLPYPLSLGLKLKTCAIMDCLCTWGGGCTYAGTQVCSCTCGGWSPPWSIILSLHLMFWDRVAHCTQSLPTGWMGWSAILKFSCLLLPVWNYRSIPPCPVFFWGGGQSSNLWSLYPKREQFLHQAISPAFMAPFSTLKMLIHCFFLCIVFHRTKRRNQFLVKGESSPVTVWQLQGT